MTIWGVDVSSIQNTVPWSALADQGASFAFLRCKIGNDAGHDSHFATNVTAAGAASLVVAPYHFAYPLPHLKPAEQVAGFVEASRIGGDLIGARPGDLPPALDLEWPPPVALKPGGKGWREWGCSAQQIVDWALEALDGMTEAWGTRPVVYVYPDFMRHVRDGASPLSLVDLAKFPLWIAGGARYGTANTTLPDLATERPPVPDPWRSWAFWQFDGNGGRKLPNGVDADHDVFNGTIDDLRALTGMPSAPAVPVIADPITTANHHAISDLVSRYEPEGDE